MTTLAPIPVLPPASIEPVPEAQILITTPTKRQIDLSPSVYIQTTRADCATPLESFEVVLTTTTPVHGLGVNVALNLGAAITDAARCIDALARLRSNSALLDQAVTTLIRDMDGADFHDGRLPPSISDDLKNLERTVHALRYATQDITGSLTGSIP